jgi:hypothetical protein
MERSRLGLAENILPPVSVSLRGGLLGRRRPLRQQACGATRYAVPSPQWKGVDPGNAPYTLVRNAGRFTKHKAATSPADLIATPEVAVAVSGTGRFERPSSKAP